MAPQGGRGGEHGDDQSPQDRGQQAGVQTDVASVKGGGVTGRGGEEEYENAQAAHVDPVEGDLADADGRQLVHPAADFLESQEVAHREQEQRGDEQTQDSVVRGADEIDGFPREADDQHDGHRHMEDHLHPQREPSAERSGSRDGSSQPRAVVWSMTTAHSWMMVATSSASRS